jgi:hypothetical protein
MKLITWLVALYNRKWQREFEAMAVMESDAEPLSAPIDEVDREIINNQPTHLSSKFRARAKRKHSNKEPQAKVTKQQLLNEIMAEEFARIADGR